MFMFMRHVRVLSFTLSFKISYSPFSITLSKGLEISISNRMKRVSLNERVCAKRPKRVNERLCLSIEPQSCENGYYNANAHNRRAISKSREYSIYSGISLYREKIQSRAEP